MAAFQKTSHFGAEISGGSLFINRWLYSFFLRLLALWRYFPQPLFLLLLFFGNFFLPFLERVIWFGHLCSYSMRFKVKVHYDSKSFNVECFYIGSRDGASLAASIRKWCFAQVFTSGIVEASLTWRADNSARQG